MLKFSSAYAFFNMVSFYDAGDHAAYTYFSDLIPAKPYPRQMTQAILALEHLLACGYSTSDVC